MGKNPLYLPLALPFFILLFLFLILLFPLIISGAFSRFFSPQMAMLLLFLSLFGSMVNVPLRTVYTRGEVLTTKIHSFYGFLYPDITREFRTRKTVIAINLGGALVPIAISTYLIICFSPALSWRFAVGIALVSAVCFKLARSVPNVGIAMPGFIPPLLAALIAILLTRGMGPSILTPALAYVSGVLGVLIGADLLHLGEITKYGSRMLSIGGAGTFDGIFLTGIISALLV